MTLPERANCFVLTAVARPPGSGARLRGESRSPEEPLREE